MIKFEDIVNKCGEITTPDENKVRSVIKNIRQITKEYVKKNKLKALVIGVSGGLDSAVVAALCQEKYTGVPLIGISIPLSSTNAHMEQAEWVGKQYCSVFEEFSEWEENYYSRETMDKENFEAIPFYEKTFEVIEKTDDIAKKAGFEVKEFPKNILKGNMKARLRMMTLYDLARKVNGMVLSTDNRSEFFAGFWTICGDVGDFGPIQNIGKGFELPAIAKILGVREDIIKQKPSDGLMVTEDNTDEAQLGATYKELDTITSIYVKDENHIPELEQMIKENNLEIYKEINQNSKIEFL